jgi:hypothetical protein
LQDSVRHLLTSQNISWGNFEVLPWKRYPSACLCLRPAFKFTQKSSPHAAPRSIRLLSLHFLHASHNPIATLNPDDTWGCRYLQVSRPLHVFVLVNSNAKFQSLALSSCALSSIGEGLSRLPHLHTLHLNSNSLASTSLDSLDLLPSLTDLDISANAMVILPKSVTKLTQLKSLRIRAMGLYAPRLLPCLQPLRVFALPCFLTLIV